MCTSSCSWASLTKTRPPTRNILGSDEAVLSRERFIAFLVSGMTASKKLGRNTSRRQDPTICNNSWMHHGYTTGYPMYNYGATQGCPPWNNPWCTLGKPHVASTGLPWIIPRKDAWATAQVIMGHPAAYPMTRPTGQAMTMINSMRCTMGSPLDAPWSSP